MFKKIRKVMDTPMTWGSCCKACVYGTIIGGVIGGIYGTLAFTDVGDKIKEKFTKHDEIDEDDFE